MGGPLQGYSGKVREMSPSADPVTRTYAAKISMLDADRGGEVWA